MFMFNICSFVFQYRNIKIILILLGFYVRVRIKFYDDDAKSKLQTNKQQKERQHCHLFIWFFSDGYNIVKMEAMCKIGDGNGWMIAFEYECMQKYRVIYTGKHV